MLVLHRFQVLPIIMVGVAVLFSAGCVYRGVDSGEGWFLDSTVIDSEAQPGDIETFTHPEGLGVSLVVASGTGGDVDCGLPIIETATDPSGPAAYAFRHNWPQRGCADVGGVVFNIVLTDAGEETTVSFQSKPTEFCVATLVKADGTVMETEIFNC